MSLFGSPFTPIVGLDISTTSLKAVELRLVGSSWKVHRWGFKPLPPAVVADGKVKDSEAAAQAIRELFTETKFSTKQVAASVSGSAVIIKKIQLANMSELELEDQIPLEAEEYIPFDIEEVYLDFQVLSRGEENMDVLLVACKKDLVDNHKATLEAAGLKPVLFDLDLFCIQNVYETLLAGTPVKSKPGNGKKPGFALPLGKLMGRGKKADAAAPESASPPTAAGEKTVALVNVGATLINMNILCGGTPNFTRDQLFGGRHLTEEVQRAFDTSYEDAVKMQLGEISPPESYFSEVLPSFLDQLSLQISQSLEFYQGSHADQPVTAVYLSGGCVLLPGVMDFLRQKSDIPVELANPFAQFKGFKDDAALAMGPRFMVAMGLAMRGEGL